MAVLYNGIEAPPQIRVKTFNDTDSWDITPYVEGLSWSSTNPGGDERATFKLKREWFSGAPEIAQGNTLQITDSIYVLWQGRIEENDRDISNTEEIGVTAYGMGVRLKDTTFQRIYVDRDLSHWEPASVQRRLNLANSISPKYTITDPQAKPDDSTGAPSLAAELTGAWALSGVPISEGWYDAGSGVYIGSVYYAWKKNNSVVESDTNWNWQVFLSGDDTAAASLDNTGNLRAAGPGTGTLASSGSRRYAFAQFNYNSGPAGNDNQVYSLYWTCLAVYGDHGLTPQGTASATAAQGLLGSDIIKDIISLASQVQARHVDDASFVIEQLEFREPTTHEDGVAEVSKYFSADWGTWATESLFDLSTNGYFDWRAKDTATQHWMAQRSICDDVNLHVEMSTLYNEVDVYYTDTSGAQQMETRTASVPLLDDAGIVRKYKLTAGALIQAGAQTLGDAFLALSGEESPARGSVTISQPITHYQRGALPSHYMRADGSNIRISDILPTKDLFSLASEPDRQTTFPIKRVDIDASGPVPKVTVDLDQTNDLLSVLQARLEMAAQVTIG